MGNGMIEWGMLSSLLGGLGLFLLGMGMMTDGLRLAAGQGLERILAAATRTRWHALGSGVLVTAVVQSSSAVTVATIGFVNAGLLSLSPALWVLFGANVGTTMTGWIVALIGLKFKIELLALPLVGIGVGLRVTGESSRRGSIGLALAGFGLLFLGISVLQEGFTALAAQISIPQGYGAGAVLLQVAAGAVMTVLMQSSSASMAIALTAAQGGLLTTQAAAAVVIGANVGTTVTALLVVMGATPNARRAAAAHVVFNAVTACVALLLLPWLIQFIAILREALGLPADPAAKLALFHTVFNVLGVMLMWPLGDALRRWLQSRFRASEGDEAQPRYLDQTVLQVPTLAIDALAREIARMGHLAVQLVRAALDGAASVALKTQQTAFAQLATAAQNFAERVNRRAMTQTDSEQLARVLRVQRYYETMVEQAALAASLGQPVGGSLTPLQTAFCEQAHAVLTRCDPLAQDVSALALLVQAEAAETAYYELKAALLLAGANAELPLNEMEEALRRYSALRRAMQQAVKAVQRLASDQAEAAEDTGRG